MFQISLDKSKRRLVILTDDGSVKYFLESKQKEWAFNPFKKQWGWQDKLFKIYEPGAHSMPGGLYKYELGLGWCGYLFSALENRISKDDKEKLLKEVIVADYYKNTPFPGLRDFQNDDVLFLLKYRMGLVTVNTGYGKTQLIATLTDYFHEALGKKVLLVCPSSKAREELVKRCKKVFGLTVSDKDKNLNGHLDCIITSGLTNSKKYKDPDLRKAYKKIISEYEIVLVDEVEYTMNEAGFFLFDSAIGAERMYGFSGTSDKVGGECISFINGLSEVVLRNRDLVKYFGPSLVFRMPTNIKVNMTYVKTKSLDLLKLDKAKMDQSGNLYQECMNQIWTDPEICKTICRIIDHYPMLYIPINSLNGIIENWIEHYWKGKYRILLICGKGEWSKTGYIYYDLNGNREDKTLDDVCDLAMKGLIDVIPGTSSSFRALDIPKLDNMLLIQSKLAANLLQMIGRCSRGTLMNIIALVPSGKRKIPVYSKGMVERDEMIKGYYKYGEINNIEIDENLLRSK